jgi:hypothetical protein
MLLMYDSYIMPKAITPPPASYPTHGFCLCGCGQKTTIADRNIPGANRFKGYPRLYIHGHNGRGEKRDVPPDRELGTPAVCECGCKA